MKKIKYLTIIFLLLFMSGCKKEPKDVSISFLQNIDVHSDVMFHDLIIDSNVSILNNNTKVDTHTLGIKKYKLNYKYNKRKYSREFEIDIIDNEKPFIYSGGNRTIYLNNKHDFCEELIFADNHDSNPKCEIIGDYNNTEVGKYNVVMEITDKSKNTTSLNMTINVIERPEDNNSNDNSTSPTELLFSTVVDNYKENNPSFGIDVSSWQGDVDYELVKEAGASFVMIRLGYQGSETGELKLDSYYKQNIKNAKEAGLKVGVYLYTDASSIKESKEHIKWLLKELGNTKLDLPIVFDWEDFSKFRKHRLSLYELNEMANIFIETALKAGYKGMLYSSKTYLENFWENKHSYPVWLAHYTDETTYEGEYLMWQLSNHGRIPGINGPVDINIMYE